MNALGKKMKSKDTKFTLIQDLETVSCDYCGSNAYKKIAHQTDLIHKTTVEAFNIVECLNCGLNYLNPRPGTKEIAKYYSDNYSFHQKSHRFKQILFSIAKLLVNSPLGYLLCLYPFSPHRLISAIQPAISDPILEAMKTGPSDLAMLDIGCGAGMTAYYWGSKGSLTFYSNYSNDLYGVEISKSARAQGNQLGIKIYPDIEDVPVDKKFDIIRMNWSLEHVHSPKKYFKFIQARLTKSGFAIITVPNYDGFLYRLFIDCVEVPIHLYHFKPNDIRNYCAECCLKVLDFRTFSFPSTFRFAAEVGLINSLEMKNMSLFQAKQVKKYLDVLDQASKGNEMMFRVSKI